jgi:hypothetical protein
LEEKFLEAWVGISQITFDCAESPPPSPVHLHRGIHERTAGFGVAPPSLQMA